MASIHIISLAFCGEYPCHFLDFLWRVSLSFPWLFVASIPVISLVIDSSEYPRCFLGDSGEYPRRFLGDSGEYPHRFLGDSGEYPRRFLGDSGEYPRRFLGDSGEYPRRFLGDSGEYTWLLVLSCISWLHIACLYTHPSSLMATSLLLLLACCPKSLLLFLSFLQWHSIRPIRTILLAIIISMARLH